MFLTDKQMRKAELMAPTKVHKPRRRGVYTKAEMDAAIKKAQNDGFNLGTMAALAVVRNSGQSTVWAEIVRCGGLEELVRFAKKDQGSWSWAGFKSWARSEFGPLVIAEILKTKTRRPGIAQAVSQLRKEHPTWSYERCVTTAKSRMTEQAHAHGLLAA